MKIRDVMQEDVKTIDANETVATAIDEMKQSKVNSLVATNESGVVGIVTGEDLAIECLGESHHSWDCQVFRHISMPVVTAPPSMALQEAIRLMVAKEINHLPILDGPKLVGFTSLSDVARRLIELNDELVAKIPFSESV